MSKAEERGKIYAIHKASEKLHDYYGLAMLSVVQFDGNDIKNAYKDGHQQAEKDVAEAFARIIRGNLGGIGNGIQNMFEQLYTDITGEKMYKGFKD